MVDTYEQSSNAFCQAASVVEKAPRLSSSTSCQVVSIVLKLKTCKNGLHTSWMMICAQRSKPHRPNRLSMVLPTSAEAATMS